MIRGLLRIGYFHGDENDIAQLCAFCPACDFEHCFRVDLTGHGRWNTTTNGVWTFNGNYDAPTFRDSMLHNKDQREPKHPLCHSYLTDGVWEYLGDCTHKLANQKVPAPPPDPNMSWKRQHGWHLIDPKWK